MLIYVDDIIKSGKNTDFIQQTIKKLNSHFQLHNLDDVHYFLGIQVDRIADGLFLHQSKYASNILLKLGMADYKHVPAPTPTKIPAMFQPITDIVQQQMYHQLVGSLQYLTITHPHISYSVNKLSQYMHFPHEHHIQLLKQLLCYIQGTLQHGLYIHSDPYFFMRILMLIGLAIQTTKGSLLV